MKQDKKVSNWSESSQGSGVQESKTQIVDQLTNISKWFGFLGLGIVLIILVNNKSIIQAKSLSQIFQDNANVIFADDFDRPDGNAIENDWIELEASETQVGIQGERLCFIDTSDALNLPVAQVSFQQITTGELLWSFDFDWTRVSREGTYRLFMQLGEASLMSDNNQNDGVGVNLVWTRVDRVHETLAYRQTELNTALTQVSGLSNFSVVANLDAKTYEVSINGSVIQGEIPFDNDVNLDTVRFFTDNLNEVNFSGRCFDNLSIESLNTVATPTPTATNTPTNSPTPTNTDIPADTPTPIPTQISTVPIYGLAEITLFGPDSIGMGTLNPFLTVVNVTFTGPQGQEIIIPGFYDGDGVGGMDGNTWKARFSPDAVGEWTFTSTSDQLLLNGHSGAIEVISPSECSDYNPGGLPDFSCMGRLKYADTHYLRFSNGDFWIKGGIDDPENFLGTAYGSWEAKKAAIDFLSSKGVNSIYVMTNTISGDSNDTWPWVGESTQEAIANSDRFDLAKLLLWEDFFAYVESNGIVLHLVLNDDSAWNGYDHDLYFREMVARFGYHPSIIWNIGEEANEIYTDSEQIALAANIKALDPYDHPVTVHRVPPWPFFGNLNFDLTSIQAQGGGQDFSSVELQNYNAVVIQHRQQGELAFRPIPIMIDEIPRITIVNEEMRKKLRAEVLYPIFLAGGNHELHYYDTSSQRGTVTINDLEPMLGDMRLARSFVETLPYWEMQPMNELLVSGQGFVFAKEDEIYSAYLPTGGQIGLDLTATNAIFDGFWFNPRDGLYQSIGYIQSGAVISFTAPSDDDWVLLLEISLATPTPTETIPATETPTPTPTFTATPTATMTLEATATAVPGVLFSDEFDRVDDVLVGNGWVEVEETGAEVGIQGNRMCFLGTLDPGSRPLVRHTFPQVSTGQLAWEFDFDWSRVGSESRYYLYMQMGEGTLMGDDAQDSGVGVNLLWTRTGFTHEMLNYRQGEVDTGLVVISGPARIRVEADLDAYTYAVFVDGVLVLEGIPFDNNVSLDTVRFFSDALSAVNFSERCFDNLYIDAIGSGVGTAPTILTTPGSLGTLWGSFSYDVNASGDPTPTYNLISSPLGMTIDPTSGLISWTPGIIGDSTVSVQATNSAGSDTQTFQISISGSPLFTCTDPVRIMPLGDSITAGKSSGVDDPSKQIGYRKDLWDTLTTTGYSIDLVGSLINGEFYAGFDPQHEGHSGWTDSQIAFNIYNNGGQNWIGQNPADVILLHIGTNSLNPDPSDVEVILTEIGQYETDNNVPVIVLLARIINQVPNNSVVTQFNDNVMAAVQGRIDSGDKIIIVDMENVAGIIYSLQPAGDMWDSLHPYETGYMKIASMWNSSLSEILPICP